MSQLDAICQNLNKKFGKDLAQKGVLFEELPRIPFTSARLNYMTHGGLPRGYLAEFYGEEHGGKTTTALDLLGQAQKVFKKEWEEEIAKLEAIANPNKEQKQKYAQLQSTGPKKCVILDVETSLDVQWAQKLGVDTDELYLFRPEDQSAEDILQIGLDMCATGEVGFLILDSVGSLYSEQQQEKTLQEKTYCGIAGPLTTFSKKITRYASSYNMIVIGINQVREDINAQYVKATTPGGKAWRHQCAFRLQFSQGKFLDDKGAELTNTCEAPSGNKVMVHIQKSKKFPRDRKEGFYTLNYKIGIHEIADLVEVCLLEGVIARRGSYYYIMDNDLESVMKDEDGNDLQFQGKSQLYSFIEDEQVILDYLNECLVNVYK